MSGRGVVRMLEGGLLGLWCPGCLEIHAVAVGTGPGPRWAFNGDHSRPTLSPSILVTGKRRLSEDEYQRIMAGERLEISDARCHSFVRDGEIQFLADCTHALAGRTVPLEPPP